MIGQVGDGKKGGWKQGGTPDCIAEIAKQLTLEETNAIAAWLATQPVPENTGPAAAFPVEMARRCESIAQRDSIQ